MLAGKLYKQMNQRVIEDIRILHNPLPNEDKRMLVRMAKEFVPALQERLKTECLPNVEFTPQTDLYFDKLKCLGDVEGRKV